MTVPGPAAARDITARAHLQMPGFTTLVFSPDPMRRWVLIILLLIYPLQLGLAMADTCCVLTAAGLTHHAAVQESSAGMAAPVLLADDAPSASADPHCPACVFAHISGFPAHSAVLPAAVDHIAAVGPATPSLSSIPRSRPERPNWRAAAS